MSVNKSTCPSVIPNRYGLICVCGLHRSKSRILHNIDCLHPQNDFIFDNKDNRR